MKIRIAWFNQIPFVDRLLFTKHLAIMLKSGIPIAEAVGILAQQSGNKQFKKILEDVLAGLANGQELGKTLGEHPEIFDPMYRSMVAIGEDSGTLEQSLEYLAKQQEKDLDFKRKVRAAMLYPAVVLVVAAVVGMAVSVFVLPQLASLFESLTIKLPLSTRILLFVAQSVRVYGVVILAALGLAVAGVALLLQTPLVKPWWHRVILQLPILGRFFQNAQLTVICRNMGLMLRSGLPINRVIRILEEGTENLVYKKYLGRIGSAVEAGQSMESELLGGKYPYISPIVGRMIGVGERTGKLDENLLYLGDFLEEEVDNTAKNLPVILEPVLLVVIAMAVAFVAFSIISPIYQFTASIHR